MAAAAEAIEIRHQMPGRLRVKVPWIRRSEDRSARMAVYLDRLDAVVDADAHPDSASVILEFEDREIAPETLLESIRDAVTDGLEDVQPPPEEPEPHAKHDGYLGTISTCGLEESFAGRLVEAIGLTGFLGYAIVRKVLGNPLPQTRGSLVAFVATAGTLPLIRQAIGEVRDEERLGLTPFLAGTCALAIVTGEALTALEIVAVMAAGSLIEDWVAERSRRSIRETLEVAERDAYALRDGAEVQIPTTDLGVGDVVVVRTGEKIPVDGTIVDGDALVDEAHMTGRSEAEAREVYDDVFAGTMVQQGRLHVEAERVGDDTYLSRMVQEVEHALAQRAPAEKHTDVLAARLLRLGGVVTLGTALATRDLMRTISVMMVMACPCATVLAASTAVAAGLAAAANNMVLIKGGAYLEEAGRVDCFCFDKTGTITVEVPRVDEVLTPGDGDADQVLELAATAEVHNTHPLARAIVDAAVDAGRKPHEEAVTEFIPGRGVRAAYDSREIVVGSTRLMQEEGIETDQFREEAGRLGDAGRTLAWVAEDGIVRGVIGLTNAPRQGADRVLNWLRADGVTEVHLVTGDSEPVARALTRELQFDDWRAELMPDEKADYVAELKSRGLRVAMIGDGVNDAVAITEAQLGVAMGAAGSEAAIEAADVALVDSELARLVEMREISHHTLRVIEQNYWMALIIDFIGMSLGAAGILPPIAGGMLHVTHSVGILANSSRLLRWRPTVVTEPHRQLPDGE